MGICWHGNDLNILYLWQVVNPIGLKDHFARCSDWLRIKFLIPLNLLQILQQYTVSSANAVMEQERESNALIFHTPTTTWLLHFIEPLDKHSIRPGKSSRSVRMI